MVELVPVEAVPELGLEVLRAEHRVVGDLVPPDGVVKRVVRDDAVGAAGDQVVGEVAVPRVVQVDARRVVLYRAVPDPRPDGLVDVEPVGPLLHGDGLHRHVVPSDEEDRAGPGAVHDDARLGLPADLHRVVHDHVLRVEAVEDLHKPSIPRGVHTFLDRQVAGGEPAAKAVVVHVDRGAGLDRQGARRVRHRAVVGGGDHGRPRRHGPEGRGDAERVHRPHGGVGAGPVGRDVPHVAQGVVVARGPEHVHIALEVLPISHGGSQPAGRVPDHQRVHGVVEDREGTRDVPEVGLVPGVRPAGVRAAAGVVAPRVDDGRPAGKGPEFRAGARPVRVPALGVDAPHGRVLAVPVGIHVADVARGEVEPRGPEGGVVAHIEGPVPDPRPAAAGGVHDDEVVDVVQGLGGRREDEEARNRQERTECDGQPARGIPQDRHLLHEDPHPGGMRPFCIRPRNSWGRGA